MDEKQPTKDDLPPMPSLEPVEDEQVPRKPVELSFNASDREDHSPTFSDESMYSGQEGRQGGHWDEVANKWHFQPSQENIDNAGGLPKLEEYFAQRDPQSVLELPTSNVPRDVHSLQLDEQHDTTSDDGKHAALLPTSHVETKLSRQASLESSRMQRTAEHKELLGLSESDYLDEMSRRRKQYSAEHTTREMSFPSRAEQSAIPGMREEWPRPEKPGFPQSHGQSLPPPQLPTINDNKMEEMIQEILNRVKAIEEKVQIMGFK